MRLRADPYRSQITNCIPGLSDSVLRGRDRYPTAPQRLIPLEPNPSLSKLCPPPTRSCCQSCVTYRYLAGVCVYYLPHRTRCAGRGAEETEVRDTTVWTRVQAMQQSTLQSGTPWPMLARLLDRSLAAQIGSWASARTRPARGGRREGRS